MVGVNAYDCSYSLGLTVSDTEGHEDFREEGNGATNIGEGVTGENHGGGEGISDKGLRLAVGKGHPIGTVTHC